MAYHTVRPMSADITGIAAADIVYDFLQMMQADRPPKRGHLGSPWSQEESARAKS